MRRIISLFLITLLCLLFCQAALAEDSQTEASDTLDMQYVLYLGTNDKDTNKPVFTEAEAMEQAKAILIRHFGGYTIQEAHGGWVDEGKLYQEYTLVIYLSDTTEDKVHAAADELVETFHQSSVLIQANPTRTEFYSGANCAKHGKAGIFGLRCQSTRYKSITKTVLPPTFGRRNRSLCLFALCWLTPAPRPGSS